MHSKRFVGASGVEEVSNEFARLEMDPNYEWEVYSKTFTRWQKRKRKTGKRENKT